MFTVETGSGFWNPIIWVSIIVIVFLIMYIFRSRGKIDYKKETNQTKSFLSGNEEDAQNNQIKASNMYWGFTENLRGIYSVLRRLHSGDASDYVLWFVVILVVFFIIVGVIV